MPFLVPDRSLTISGPDPALTAAPAHRHQADYYLRVLANTAFSHGVARDEAGAVEGAYGGEVGRDDAVSEHLLVVPVPVRTLGVQELVAPHEAALHDGVVHRAGLEHPVRLTGVCGEKQEERGCWSWASMIRSEGR